MNETTTNKSLKRKFVSDSSQTFQGTAKKHTPQCTSTTTAFTEETDEIAVVFESNAAVSANNLMLIDTSKYENEFGKRPFFSTKSKRNNTYTRNEKVPDVELNVPDGASLSDPGDIVLLDEHSVREEEIRCYNRILTRTSSRKHRSKRDEQKKPYCCLESHAPVSSERPYPPKPDDDLQNGEINLTGIATTGEIFNVSSGFFINDATNVLNKFGLSFDELQSTLDTNKDRSNLSSQNDKIVEGNNFYTYPAEPADDVQNHAINVTKTASNISSTGNFCTNGTINCRNEVCVVSFDEIQKALDTIKNTNVSNCQNKIITEDNNSQYCLNSANLCVTNSFIVTSNLQSSHSTDYLNEITVDELRKLVDAATEPNNENRYQDEIISRENNVECFINTSLVNYIEMETVKSPSTIAAEDCFDEYEDLEPFYNGVDIESNEDNDSLVSSEDNSLKENGSVKKDEFISTNNVNFLTHEKDNYISFEPYKQVDVVGGNEDNNCLVRSEENSDSMKNNEFIGTDNIITFTRKKDRCTSFYGDDKDTQIEKSIVDEFSCDYINCETDSFDFNDNFYKDEKFFCNSKTESADDEISDAEMSLKNNMNKEFDDLNNVLGSENFVENSTPENTVEATKSVHGKETEDSNFSIVSSTSKEIDEDTKSNEKKLLQPFYGKRISNRGNFLTRKCSMKPPLNPKISKKKTFKVIPNIDTNPEEIHASLKTPDINIDFSTFHLHGNRHKYIDSSRKNINANSSYQSNSRRRSVKDTQNTSVSSRYQVHSINNTINQNSSLYHTPLSAPSPDSTNNSIPVQSTVSNTYVPPTNFMPRTISHLNSFFTANNHLPDNYVANRFPSFPVIPVYQIQHPFQPYLGPRIAMPVPRIPLQYVDTRFPPPVYSPRLPFQTYTDATQGGSFVSHSNFDSTFETRCNNEDTKKYTPPILSPLSDPGMLSPNVLSNTPTLVSSSLVDDVSSTLCLVPSDLKSLIGSRIFKTEEVLFLILEWNVDSVIHHREYQSPLISPLTPIVLRTFTTFEDFYKSFHPLLMLETWARFNRSYQSHSSKQFSAEIYSYSVEKDHVIIKCKSVYNIREAIPDPGSMVVIDYVTESGERTSKIFGYLIHSKLRHFDPQTDSETCRYSTQPAETEDFILAVTIKTVCVLEHVSTKLPVRIQLLYTLKYTLKQHEALLFVERSPFKKYILNPNAEGLSMFSLKKTCTEEDIDKNINNVIEKFSASHPDPVMAIVRCTDKHDYDHLRTVSSLFKVIKSKCKNMKVLVCVRNRQTLEDIADILKDSHKDMKFIIMLNNRLNIKADLRDFLFDDTVKEKIDEKKVEREVTGDDICEIKKNTVLESDVFISWARDIHDRFLVKMFSEAKCIENMCCIIDEAQYFTETESLIPTLYGISKLILIGNTDRKPRVFSHTAKAHNFDKSYFHRACSLLSAD